MFDTFDTFDGEPGHGRLPLSAGPGEHARCMPPGTGGWDRRRM